MTIIISKEQRRQRTTNTSNQPVKKWNLWTAYKDVAQDLILKKGCNSYHCVPVLGVTKNVFVSSATELNGVGCEITADLDG